MNELQHPANSLHLLSGGAAQGLVTALRARFETPPVCTIAGEFGAVGVMMERLLAGRPCDVLIVTRLLVNQLTDLTHLRAGSSRDLGVVKTGIAVQHGQASPRVDTPEALKVALLAASAIYFPDPVKATAGIHFMKVMQRLGIAHEVASRLKPFPNGATAMREMADERLPGAIGCTQVTEILFTPGVKLVSVLPTEFELATVYTAAISAKAQRPDDAAALINLLVSAEHAALRKTSGFE
jgi:molybdate transport system substrate-binding protein